MLPDPASPLNALPQVANDPTAIPIGQGAVFLPAYTTGDREPPVTVLQDGGVVAEGQAGARVVLPPGDYDVRFGSGTFSQQVRVPVAIQEGRTTVLPPTWSGLVVGAATFNRTDQVGEQAGWDLGLSLFFDTTASFQRDAHQWITRLELEEEQSRPEDGEFTNEGDRLFLHTIYTYHLVPWFGPYLRVGLETKLLDRHQVFEQAQTVDELDRGGNVVKTHVDVDRVKLGGPFAPLILQQGAGGNFRLLRRRNVELDLRLGFGARQTLANDLLVYESVAGAADRLVPAEDASVLGPEGTVVGIGRLSRWVTITSEFDGLLPVSDDAAVFTWRNQAGLRLIRYVSINYRFNATRDPNLDVEDTIRTEHDVQLRFSYTLF
ncbi:MAG: hypothetical protein R3F60_16875 [bacterium]